MGPVKEGSLKKLCSQHVVSFFLGAPLPMVVLFVLASDRVGEQLSGISGSWLGNSNGGTPGAAPAPLEHAVERFPGLAELLPKVCTEDRTVIITSVNEAWARPGSLLDLYLESFNNGEDTAHLLDHLLVVALDPAGFRRCVAVHPHCYLLEVTTVNLTSAARFMSRQYLELVWTKLELQQRVLELGYNFLFTDTDMLVLRNPFRRIPVYADMSVSSDDYSAARAHPLDNPLNTGLYYVKATSRGVRVLKYWRAARARFPGAHDQSVFHNIKRELVQKLGVAIEPLDTVYFGGFCEYHDDLASACTMHADCCVGVDNKVHDLKDVAADWKRYTRMAPEERKKAGGNVTWTVPARCRRSVNWSKPVHP
ncbi:hypothetical protein CFC21_049448 [Triticum aestivum]|uniref:Nucleotide-diphospho-sugar transferase domain-containing protein n=2 Tax=Triticum aestivum TaxID=4565 RepID=A0A9R1G294_WHEAT|nr:uncharacterized protein At4g15970-like [Triticum aestivum]KAF7039456.1 hypothetical protein CFC21_049448 [Triticum aestivum]